MCSDENSEDEKEAVVDEEWDMKVERERDVKVWSYEA